MKVLVTGANGQLGSEMQSICHNYEYDFLFTDIGELDITKRDEIYKFTKDHPVDVIVNCAAYTAVDRAEDEPELATLINETAVNSLVEISNENKIQLIHISTDYVFDGKKTAPYKEEDPANPLSVYGGTKRAGELAILNQCENGIILRTSWLYSSYGRNFVKTILRLAQQQDTIPVVFDQAGTPTYGCELARTILDILPEINQGSSELYHYSNEGVASWFDFAYAIGELTGSRVKLTPVESEYFDLKASRPHYSVLNKGKIKAVLHRDIPYWKESLEKCLEALSHQA